MKLTHVDVKTTDSYLVNLPHVDFTKKYNQIYSSTFYVQPHQICQVWKKMRKIMTQEVQLNYVTEVVNTLIPDNIEKDIARTCQSFYLLYNIFVREVKMLKKPIFEMEKLMELHGEGDGSGKPTGDETGTTFEQSDGYCGGLKRLATCRLIFEYLVPN